MDASVDLQVSNRELGARPARAVDVWGWGLGFGHERGQNAGAR
jgi:hypothetical protein